MCAQYTLETTTTQLEEALGLKISGSAMTFAQRILPHKPAPVLVMEKSEVKIKIMTYSLVPSWSPEPKPKFATYNARIETIAEKPSWRKPLTHNRCLVPLTGFIEAIHNGPDKKFPLGDNMVEFYQGNDLLFAAGLYDTWINKTTGEVLESFAIITDEPPKFVAENGHDRCPIFLKPESYLQWLDPELRDSKKILHLLRTQKETPELSIKVDRPLKKKAAEPESLSLFDNN